MELSARCGQQGASCHSRVDDVTLSAVILWGRTHDAPLAYWHDRAYTLTSGKPHHTDSVSVRRGCGPCGVSI